MKKPLVLVLAVICIVFNLSAQSKPGKKLSPAEAAYCNTVYNVLAAAIPHSYRDWVFTDVAKNFPEGQPYTVCLSYAYEMPEEQNKAIMASAYKKINDPNNVKQMATALKWAATNKLKITVAVNVQSQSAISLTYCNLAPSALELPVSATLSVIGLHTDACPVTTNGKADMNGDYFDSAIVFLGKPALRKKTDKQNDGLMRATYYIGFDKTKINQLTTQNMVISLKGDVADINAAIKLIDWVKLYVLLGAK